VVTGALSLLGSWIIGFLAVVGMFILLIAPHEGGHFAFAKLFKVNVIEFSLGMGTKLWSATRAGTLYALRLLPIGGYVRLGGMEPGDYDTPNGFHSKSAWQRILVLLGGPAANFLLAAIIATGLALTQVNYDPGKVEYVIKPSPAYDAGIRPGDRIQSVDGKKLSNPTDIRSAVANSNGNAVTVIVRKSDGRTVTLSLVPLYNDTERRAVIGVGTSAIVTPADAVTLGVTFPITASIGISVGIYQLASGQIPGGLLGPEGATGAIGIGYLTVQAAHAGWFEWLNVLALLSVALGLANLLPLPALDGGRIVVVLLEKLRGRPFDREKEMQFQRFGLVALLALVAFIAYFDIQRIVNHQFPGIR
jgi:regulator of sigma E protease